MSWNRKQKGNFTEGQLHRRKTSQKENSAMRSVESTRNQTAQMRSFGRDISNIIHQPIYRKDHIGDAYNQKRLLTKGDSSERAKRAVSVSGNQPNKQFMSIRGSNTLKTISKC